MHFRCGMLGGAGPDSTNTAEMQLSGRIKESSKSLTAHRLYCRVLHKQYGNTVFPACLVTGDRQSKPQDHYDLLLSNKYK